MDDISESATGVIIGEDETDDDDGKMEDWYLTRHCKVLSPHHQLKQ